MNLIKSVVEFYAKLTEENGVLYLLMPNGTPCPLGYELMPAVTGILSHPDEEQNRHGMSAYKLKDKVFPNVEFDTNEEIKVTSLLKKPRLINVS